jgi:thioredoxin 1
MSAEVTVTSKNFDTEVKQSDVPVLVDFWAEWCMPCRMVAPVLEEISLEYQGKVKVAKVNVDQEPDLASAYNIISIPTLLLFKNGEAVKQKVGAAPKAAIVDLFKSYV